MTHLAPLTAGELLAVQRKHQERLHALRARGWGRLRPLTRNEVCDLTIDRYLLKRG